ncbi:hypothetical protein OE749_01670 [Aestuariibacter sp. AA17]|uniref:Uncharacterized protein n=1 Tax=Fluctibacter corallii TaxID=2984329 RepID=A0ABT3A407_9ALTE|nr:hypothetical protein [Aestuariibacter sp. AA17]MCV2883405.1 hypothetical protein [Aestuariibacter sp. AA17]
MHYFSVTIALLLTFFSHSFAYAGGYISEFEVTDQFLHFSITTPKAHSLPQCVASDKAQKWAVAINTQSGKNLYAVVILAANSGKRISVTSAHDCADVEGIERPLRIRLSQ